jgi:hypothetical protein
MSPRSTRSTCPAGRRFVDDLSTQALQQAEELRFAHEAGLTWFVVKRARW